MEDCPSVECRVERERCLKFGFLIFNILIYFGGITMLGLSLWVYTERNYLNVFYETNLHGGFVLAMVIMGALSILMSLIGCIVAIKRIRCLLLAYIVISLIIVVTLLISGILAFVFRENVKNTLAYDMKHGMDGYDQNPSYARGWDRIQEMYSCCGVNKYTDWESKVPESCCKWDKQNDKKFDCKGDKATADNVFTVGCLQKGINMNATNALVLGIAAIILVFMMLCAVMFACGIFLCLD